MNKLILITMLISVRAFAASQTTVQGFYDSMKTKMPEVQHPLFRSPSNYFDSIEQKRDGNLLCEKRHSTSSPVLSYACYSGLHHIKSKPLIEAFIWPVKLSEIFASGDPDWLGAFGTTALPNYAGKPYWADQAFRFDVNGYLCFIYQRKETADLKEKEAYECFRNIEEPDYVLQPEFLN